MGKKKGKNRRGRKPARKGRDWLQIGLILMSVLISNLGWILFVFL